VNDRTHQTLQRPDTNGLGRVVPRVADIRARSAAPCSVRRSRTLDCWQRRPAPPPKPA